MTTDVTARIRQFINREILLADEAGVEDDTPLVGGVLDSMALMRLVAFLEEEFGIEIDDTDVSATNFGTVRDVARLVEQNGGPSAP
ncbi:MAG TPA: acyl carrier protein [Actinomycetota bacterium]|nr:acyl carrier protein [Actinomycetota bacterium]